MEKLSRRKFLLGVSAAVAAPAIVRVASIMPVKRYSVVAFDPGEMSGSLVARMSWQGPNIQQISRAFRVDESKLLSIYDVAKEHREHYVRARELYAQYTMPPLILKEDPKGNITLDGIATRIDLRPGKINDV